MSDVALSGADADETWAERAAKWADALVSAESRGPGDLDNARRRVARRHGLSHSILWRLRYRRPKDVLTSVYFALYSAYEAECARQIKRLEHELELTKAVAGAHHRDVRAVEALVGTEDLPQAGMNDIAAGNRDEDLPSPERVEPRSANARQAIDCEPAH